MGRNVDPAYPNGKNKLFLLDIFKKLKAHFNMYVYFLLHTIRTTLRSGYKKHQGIKILLYHCLKVLSYNSFGHVLSPPSFYLHLYSPFQLVNNTHGGIKGLAWIIQHLMLYLSEFFIRLLVEKRYEDCWLNDFIKARSIINVYWLY